MKKEILSSTILTALCIIFFSGLYPLILTGIAELAPGKGEGILQVVQGKKYYVNIAQKFTDDKYFWPRPSVVDYNAAGSAGSNKGPSNTDYLALVQLRIDTFSARNPDIAKQDIPSELVTSSGSGLDPDISPQAALAQASRVAKSRNISIEEVKDLIKQQTEKPLLGLLGPEKINVLKLNIELDNLN